MRALILALCLIPSAAFADCPSTEGYMVFGDASNFVAIDMNAATTDEAGAWTHDGKKERCTAEFVDDGEAIELTCGSRPLERAEITYDGDEPAALAFDGKKLPAFCPLDLGL